ncbi:MAG: hypothetical protein ACI865_001487 [Flavobacteriaceae bacterium]
MRVATFILSLLILSACNKKKFFDGPNSYVDDFESYTSFDELTAGDDLNWSFTQITREANTIVLSTEQAHSGTNSIKFNADSGADGDASKASLVKQKMAFYDGETVRASIWYYIEGTQTLDWLFLLDIEEQTAIGAGPGMRVANIGSANNAIVEFKYPEPVIYQETSSLPRDQWFELTLETKLSQKKKGWVKLYQDGQLILEKKAIKTLPKDILYQNQGTKGMYTSIEIGITANSRDNASVVYADDFSIKVID